MGADELRALADQLALQRLVTDYAYAIDLRDFDALDRVFVPDAHIDYRAMGGIAGDYATVKPWLKQALANFPGYMHLTGNLRFDVDGDEATGTIACFNPMVLPPPDKATPGHVLFLGLWYHDRYRRTAEGWRIVERVETKSYDYNVPEPMRVALAAQAARNG